MKRLILFLVLVTNYTYSQGLVDALETSNTSIYGSARYQAMGGAFTALGGDLSATHLNPASAAVFLESEAIISYSTSFNSIDTDFYNAGGKSKNTYGNVNNMGIVITTASGDNPEMRFAFSYSYNRVANYNENINFEGNNSSYLEVTSGNQLFYEGYSTLAASFVLASNNYTPNRLPFAEGLAFDTYLTDINDPSSSFYDPRYPDYSDTEPVYVTSVIANNSLQKYTSDRSGIAGTHTFAMGLDIMSNVYLGVSYKSTFIDKTTRIEIHETDFDPTSTIESFTYKSYVETFGRASSISLGAIYKSETGIRIGAAYHFPEKHSLQDIYYYSINTKFKTPDSNNQYEYDAQSPQSESSYAITNPARFNIGFAYVFGKKGLISFDYNHVNYQDVKYEPYNEFYYENEEIQYNFKSTSNISLGMEYNISYLTLRGGYKYMQTPYQNTNLLSDSQIFSLGTGLNFKGWKIDVSYAHLLNNSRLYMYEVDLVEAARINRKVGDLTFSLRVEI